MTTVLLGIGTTLAVIAIVLIATSDLRSGTSFAVGRTILGGLVFFLASVVFGFGHAQVLASLAFVACVIAVLGAVIRHQRFISTGR